MNKTTLSGRFRIGVRNDLIDKQLTAWMRDPGVRAALASSGMTLFDERQTTRGFTLIELLVVVLIIGILAAVALPQYQFAVAKARAVQLITIAHNIVQSQERYYLANNTYSDQLDNLDIDVPRQNLGITFLTTPHLVTVEDSRLANVSLYCGYPHTSNTFWQNVCYCYALKTNDSANKLCAHIANNSQKLDNNGGYWIYKMQ